MLLGLREAPACGNSNWIPSWLAHNRCVTGDSGGLTLHLEKVLQARTERVFAACVEPEKLAERWGPAGFTSPSLDIDVRHGARYRITMQPPDGESVATEWQRARVAQRVIAGVERQGLIRA